MSANGASVDFNDTAEVITSGYDLPLLGWNDGNFTLIHCTAIASLAVSIVCATLTIALTIKYKKCSLRQFRRWSTGDRSLIYMAVFDASFNVTHISDHIVYLVQHNHPGPPSLCSFFGFMLSVFQIAQNVYVSCLAIKGCVMVFRMRLAGPLERDWPSLLLSIGSGVVFSAVSWILDKFGPSGAFCYLDPVKAPFFLLFFTTVFLLGTGIFNLFFYLLTVLTLKSIERRNQLSLGTCNNLSRSAKKTAWTCSYFVISFFCQWTAVSVYGAWSLTSLTPPFWLFLLVTTTTNLGGFFNLLLFVYIQVKRRKRRQRGINTTASHRSLHRDGSS